LKQSPAALRVSPVWPAMIDVGCLRRRLVQIRHARYPADSRRCSMRKSDGQGIHQPETGSRARAEVMLRDDAPAGSAQVATEPPLGGPRATHWERRKQMTTRRDFIMAAAAATAGTTALAQAEGAQAATSAAGPRQMPRGLTLLSMVQPDGAETLGVK